MGAQRRQKVAAKRFGMLRGAAKPAQARDEAIRRLIELARVEELATQLDSWTELWHREPAEEEEATVGFLGLLKRLHLCNFKLWHEEDEARREDVPDAVIVQHKRAIDRWNQHRNDTIEQLDEFLLAALVREGVRVRCDAELNSETPGSILDRLSIASLKIYHMAEQAGRTDVDVQHRQVCAAKHKVLREQRQDLLVCFERLLVELLSGQKRLKLYKQFKMYNDPTLNPALYSARKRQGGKAP